MDKKKTKTDKPVGSQHSDPDPRISRLLAEGTLIGSIALCLIMLVALLTYSAQDQVGQLRVIQSMWPTQLVQQVLGLLTFFYTWFGVMAYLFPVLLAIRALQILRTRFLQAAIPFDILTFNLRLVGFTLVMIAATSLASIQFEDHVSNYDHGYGGIIGKQIADAILQVFSFTGSTVILLALLLFGLTVFADISWIFIIDRIGQVTLWTFDRLATVLSSFRRQRQEKLIAKEAQAERSSKVEAAIKKNNNVYRQLSVNRPISPSPVPE